MILRRLTLHVKDQNWFAVCLDFLIVVVGVFVGLQVQNWNTDRMNAQQEQRIMRQLHQQFGVFIEKLERNIEKQTRSRDASAELLSIISLGKAPEDTDSFRQLLVKNNSLSSAPSQPTALQELVLSGQLSNLQSAELRSLLSAFYQDYTQHTERANIALALITNSQNKYHQVVRTDPYEWGKIISFNAERIGDLRPEVQNFQIGKRGLILQMNHLYAKAQEIEISLQEKLP
jgi:hypothetical protein